MDRLSKFQPPEGKLIDYERCQQLFNLQEVLELASTLSKEVTVSEPKKFKSRIIFFVSLLVMFMLSWKFTLLALGMMIGKYLLMLCFREAANKREEEIQFVEKELQAITVCSFKANADIDHLVDSFMTKKEEIEKKAKTFCVGSTEAMELFFTMCIVLGAVGYSQSIYVHGGFAKEEKKKIFGSFTPTPAVLLSFNLYF